MLVKGTLVKGPLFVRDGLFGKGYVIARVMLGLGSWS